MTNREEMPKPQSLQEAAIKKEAIQNGTNAMEQGAPVLPISQVLQADRLAKEAEEKKE